MFSQVASVSVMGKQACQLMYKSRDSILSQYQHIKRIITLNGKKKPQTHKYRTKALKYFRVLEGTTKETSRNDMIGI